MTFCSCCVADEEAPDPKAMPQSTECCCALQKA